jgi:hypothetical protein
MTPQSTVASPQIRTSCPAFPRRNYQKRQDNVISSDSRSSRTMSLGATRIRVIGVFLEGMLRHTKIGEPTVRRISIQTDRSREGAIWRSCIIAPQRGTEKSMTASQLFFFID